MSAVDPENDDVARWVVHHYRYDSARNERRNVVVAAFDNAEEFDLEIAKRVAELRLEQAAGTRSAAEQISGVALPAGYLAEAARGHAIKTAIQHGATKAAILVQPVGTTGSVVVLRASEEK
jgi:hypothetical protein